MAEASQDGGISISLDFLLKVFIIFIWALAEVEDRMKIYEQKEVKTDLLPDSTLLANIEGMVKEFFITGKCNIGYSIR